MNDGRGGGPRASGALLVAELSANHGGSLDVALRTVRAARDAGADAVKIQTYTPDTITIDCDEEPFQIRQGTIWDGRTLYSLYQEAHTPWEWHEPIRDEARRLGLAWFSTPFDPTAVDFLVGLGAPVMKIASFEINDIPLIEYAASKRLPMLISTGIADLGMIEEAVAACRRAGNNDITLLKCTSSYPAPPDLANLRTIPSMAETFGVPVGLSDHTMGSSVALAAVALGATVVEKHFILDRAQGGPDAAFSMEPGEFALLVKGVREVERALGTVSYDVSDDVRKSRAFSRSLFVVRDMEAGEVFTAATVRSIRPGAGLHTRHYAAILGRRARRAVRRGTPLSWDLVE